MINRLKLFCENETYTYIKDIFDYHFNGFVLEVYDTKILFSDDVLGDIEINFSDIKIVNYSTRNKGVEE